MRQTDDCGPGDARPEEGRPEDGRPEDGRPVNGRPLDGRPANPPEALLRRTRFYEAPPIGIGGFDPFTATPEEFRRYALPVAPDRRLQPLLHRVWRTFFTPIGAAKLQVLRSGFAPGVTTAYRISAFAPVPPGATGRESSLNWSGGYVTPNRGASFTGLAGTWTVPTVQLPPGGSATDSFRSSIFIGLDGQRSYRHASLPQIGTTQIAGTGGLGNLAPYHAWFQWWERDHTSAPVPLDVTVAPGDRVAALLTVLDPTTVRLNLRVGDTVLTGIDVTAPSSAETPPVQYRVSGATAEWIMERPSALAPPHAPYPLPRYEDFAFTDCVATAADPFGAVRSFDMEQARLIRMQDTPRTPHRRRTISVARRTGAQAVRLRYVEP